MTPILGIFASSRQTAVPPVIQDAFDSIQTTTTAGTVTFNSIPQTYKHLQLRVIGKNGNGTYPSVYWTVRFNADTGNNYDCHSLFGNGTSAGSMYNGTYVNQMIAGEIVASGSGQSASNSSPLIIDILDYTNTNKNKVMRAVAGYDGAGSGNIRLSSGVWLNTSAITSITVIGSDTGTLHAALYGIKEA